MSAAFCSHLGSVRVGKETQHWASSYRGLWPGFECKEISSSNPFHNSSSSEPLTDPDHQLCVQRLNFCPTESFREQRMIPCRWMLYHVLKSCKTSYTFNLPRTGQSDFGLCGESFSIRHFCPRVKCISPVATGGQFKKGCSNCSRSKSFFFGKWWHDHGIESVETISSIPRDRPFAKTCYHLAIWIAREKPEGPVWKGKNPKVQCDSSVKREKPEGPA